MKLGDSSSPVDNTRSLQGNRWAIVGILGLGVVAYLLLGGASSDDGCGESPPYLSEEARICFVVGYEGPMNSENMIEFLDVTLDEAERLAAEDGWTVYVKRRDDGLDPDVVTDDEVPTRLGVELEGDTVVRIWPG